MSLLNKIKNALSGSNDEKKKAFDQIIESSLKEAEEGVGMYRYKVQESENYKNIIKDWNTTQKVDFILYCIDGISHYWGKSIISYSSKAYEYNRIKDKFLVYLCRVKIELNDADLLRLLKAFNSKVKYSNSGAGIFNWPLGYFFNQVAKQYTGKELSSDLVEALENTKTQINKVKLTEREKDKLKLTQKINGILLKGETTNAKEVLFIGKDDFAEYANAYIHAISNQEEKQHLFNILSFAQQGKSSKPSKKYLKESHYLIQAIGAERFKEIMNDWFVFIVHLEEKMVNITRTYHGGDYEMRECQLLAPVNMELLKGLVWMCSHFNDTVLLQNIADLAERCYRKVPNYGALAVLISNACFYTLYKSEGLEGIAHLTKLNELVKQPSGKKAINKYIALAAKEKGVSLSELEDQAIDDFGLIKGRKEQTFDDYRAIIELTKPGRTNFYWIKPDGKIQKSIPAFVKTKYAAELKQLKASKKEIEKTSTIHKNRLDFMYRKNRVWQFSDFKKQYLHHGLMSMLANKLIWRFQHKENHFSAFFLNEEWVDSQQNPITIPNDSELVLWHPAESSIEEVRQWRKFMIDNEIQQPFKQAYREVYLLTDAEINTRIYSNRMAAHILKQYQFVSIAKTRNWKTQLQGPWDGGDMTPTIEIPEHQLRAEFWADPISEDQGESGVYLYLGTDQVRFVNTQTNDAIELMDVPPVVFSEIMRDVDLFVGVCSIGNDPSWNDNGGAPRYNDYWQRYSFGDLTVLAETRKEILSNLIPRLKIRNVAHIDGKFLVVKGKLRTYKIHLGSTNILMEPNDQYLCIVPDRSKKDVAKKIFIPFEGDNALSVILSKAFLLAEDEKIQDTTITSQILKK